MNSNNKSISTEHCLFEFYENEFIDALLNSTSNKLNSCVLDFEDIIKLSADDNNMGVYLSKILELRQDSLPANKSRLAYKLLGVDHNTAMSDRTVLANRFYPYVTSHFERLSKQAQFVWESYLFTDPVHLKFFSIDDPAELAFESAAWLNWVEKIISNRVAAEAEGGNQQLTLNILTGQAVLWSFVGYALISSFKVNNKFPCEYFIESDDLTDNQRNFICLMRKWADVQLKFYNLIVQSSNTFKHTEANKAQLLSGVLIASVSGMFAPFIDPFLINERIKLGYQSMKIYNQADFHLIVKFKHYLTNSMLNETVANSKVSWLQENWNKAIESLNISKISLEVANG